ncbi:MAG: hypothetical protein QM763_10780 [Agriterribacter sp.]
MKTQKQKQSLMQLASTKFLKKTIFNTDMVKGGGKVSEAGSVSEGKTKVT